MGYVEVIEQPFLAGPRLAGAGGVPIAIDRAADGERLNQVARTGCGPEYVLDAGDTPPALHQDADPLGLGRPLGERLIVRELLLEQTVACREIGYAERHR